MSRSPLSCCPPLLGFLLAAAAAVPASAWACGGGFVVPPGTPVEDTLYNQASHIVLGFGEDGAGAAQTTVTIAMDVVGSTDGFGVVFPVPTALGPEDVALADPDTVTWVRQLTGVREHTLTCDDLRDPVEYTCPPTGDRNGGDGGSGELGGPDPTVTVTDTWTLGDFEATALEADDGADLADWLREEGLEIPAAMEPALAAYVEAGMAFVTLRIPEGTELDPDALLPPVQLRLPGRLDRVPLQLGAATAQEPMDVFFYTLDEWDEGGEDSSYIAGISNHGQFEVDDHCMPREGGPTEAYATVVEATMDPPRTSGWVATTTTGAGVFWEESWDEGWYSEPLQPEAERALVALGAPAAPAIVSRLHLRFLPGALDEDPVFYRSASVWGRAHTFHPSFDATLSSDLPVCGEGIVAEGSCPPPRVDDSYCADDNSDDDDKGSGCAVAASGAGGLLVLLPLGGLLLRRRR